MNKRRRAELEKATALIEQAITILEICRSDEQDYYDNMPEALQSGDKGDKAEEAVEAMLDAQSNAEIALDHIMEACT